jgi:gliding motility-associated-like protein
VAYNDVTCYGANNGKIVVFSHGEGLSYEYSLDGGKTFYSNQGVFNNLPPGEDYNIMVREDSVCTAMYDEIIRFSEPTEIIIDYNLTSPSCEDCSDGQIMLAVSGGMQPYSILWSNFETGTRRVNIALGEYSVAVTDQSNCRVLKTITLEMGHGSLVIPNAFTPNEDGINDVWTVEALNNYNDAIVQIFDRFGKLVYESERGYPEPWDGKQDGEYVPMGTYYFLINLDGFSEPIPGSLTVIR